MNSFGRVEKFESSRRNARSEMRTAVNKKLNKPIRGKRTSY